MAGLSEDQKKAKEGIDDLMALMTDMQNKVGDVAQQAMAAAQRSMEEEGGYEFDDLSDAVIFGDADLLNNAMCQCEQFMLEHVERRYGRTREPNTSMDEYVCDDQRVVVWLGEDPRFPDARVVRQSQEIPALLRSRSPLKLAAPKPLRKPRAEREAELFDTCVKLYLDDFAAFLRLSPVEKKALREQAGLPLPETEDMRLDDVAVELAIDTAEFRKHCRMLSKKWVRTVPEVVKYLYENAVLLTAEQARQIFKVAFERVSNLATTATMEGRLSIRCQLVVALHCFCVQPYVCWEDDGDNQCTWANMTYNDCLLWDTGLCEDSNGEVAGVAVRWGTAREGTCKGGCGYWPNPGKNGYCSLCSVGKGPVYPGGKRPETVEEARLYLREDVSSIRSALKASRPNELRAHYDRRHAFSIMTKPEFYQGGLHALHKGQMRFY